jgi:MinD superfamily P-loop ATPase
MKIAVASGKGGTGKTTIATNLADFLSNSNPVILADLDVEEPNSGLFIDLPLVSREDKFTMIPEWDEARCSSCWNCIEVCNFNALVRLGQNILVFPQLCHSCFACAGLCPDQALRMVPRKMGELRHFQSDRLVFIESRLEIGQEQAVPLIAETKKYIHQHLNGEVLIIYDSPPGTSCPVIEAVYDADFVILVTEPTPFGLHDLKLSVETIRKLNKDFGVVINRWGIGNNAVMDYCRDEKIPVIARIPNMRRIAELYSQGHLLYRDIGVVEDSLKLIRDYLSGMEGYHA